MRVLTSEHPDSAPTQQTEPITTLCYQKKDGRKKERKKKRKEKFGNDLRSLHSKRDNISYSNRFHLRLCPKLIIQPKKGKKKFVSDNTS